MELQATPFSAMAKVAEDPVRLVEGRRAACDGGEPANELERSVAWGLKLIWIAAGGGPLGHPKVYINLVSATGLSCQL